MYCSTRKDKLRANAKDRKPVLFGSAGTKMAVLFLSLASFPVVPLWTTDGIASRVEEYMHAEMTLNRFRGSILIARDGKILVSKGYRVVTLKSGVLNTSATRVHVGSIAMQFTDTAVLQLQEKGALHVQDSVCEYIKRCPNDWSGITLFDLMTHTSGIPEIRNVPDHENSSSRAPTSSELLDLIKKEPLQFRPGEKLDCSYSEDEVLHAVIEAASGEPYTTYLDRHIFKPLRMRDTGYDGTLRTPSQPETVSVLLPSDIERSLLYTAGGLYSTAKDLYFWNCALATDKVISQESLQQMFTPYRDGYGFGWMVQKQLGRRLVTQGDGIRMYSTSILRYPDDDVCVIVLSQSETTDAEKVSKDIAAILFGDHYELPMKHKVVTLDPASYDGYVGRYTLAPNFVLTVTKDVDRLMIQGTGQAKIEILPASETVFSIKGSDTKINFIKIANGRATQLILQQGGRDIPAARIN
jgi:CubicO group peptidase (beta-lactamase class C family)